MQEQKKVARKVYFSVGPVFFQDYICCAHSEYNPEKTKPSERRKANQNHPKRAKKQRRNTRNTPEEEKRTPELQAKGPSQQSHEPSIAMEDDLAISKLDR